MTETPGVYRIASKPTWESQLSSLPPDVRSVAESLQLRDMESAKRYVSQYLGATRKGKRRMSETPKFEEKLVHTSAAIRITGSKQEIDLVVNALVGEKRKTLRIKRLEAGDRSRGERAG